METAIIVFAVFLLWGVGCLTILAASYPYDPPAMIGWWPIWLVTVFPIRIVKQLLAVRCLFYWTYKWICVILKEIIEEIKL